MDKQDRDGQQVRVPETDQEVTPEVQELAKVAQAEQVKVVQVEQAKAVQPEEAAIRTPEQIKVVTRAIAWRKPTSLAKVASHTLPDLKVVIEVDQAQTDQVLVPILLSNNRNKQNYLKERKPSNRMVFC
jgi:hypothetical protein